MKALPNLEDQQAMLEAGRRATLRKARNEACEALRDATVACQSATLVDVDEPAREAMAAAHRLVELHVLWTTMDSST